MHSDWKDPKAAGNQDFWRTVVGDILPDGTLDKTDIIHRYGRTAVRFDAADVRPVTSTLSTFGSFASPVFFTANPVGALTLDESFSMVEIGNASKTINLPNAGTCFGREYQIQFTGDAMAPQASAGTNVITLVSLGGGINGFGRIPQTAILLKEGDVRGVRVKSDGTNWQVIGTVDQRFVSTEAYTVPTNRGPVHSPIAGLNYGVNLNTLLGGAVVGPDFQINNDVSIFTSADSNFNAFLKLPAAPIAGNRTFSYYHNALFTATVRHDNTDMVGDIVMEQGRSLHFEWADGRWNWIPAPRLQQAQLDVCPGPMTRVQLIALRNAGGLSKACHYIVTDHTQGRLVAGTLIEMHAVDAFTLSENVSVKTTYDNEAWFGIFNLDDGFVTELRDNRGNMARGSNGVAVAQFDWGNPAYTGTTVDNATMFVTIGATSIVNRFTVSENSTVQLTGFTGVIADSKVIGGSTVNLTGANATWQQNEWRDGISFQASAYTGGGTQARNIFSGGSVNISNRATAATFLGSQIYGSTIIANAVTGGPLNFDRTVMNAGSTFTQSALAGSATIQTNLITSATISHGSGTLNVSGTTMMSSSNIQTSGAAVGTSVSTVTISNGALISNAAAGSFNVSSSSLANSSLIRALTGSTGVLSVTGSNLMTGSAVTLGAGATANLTLSTMTMTSNSSITQNSAATMILNRSMMDSGATIQTVTGAGGALTVGDISMSGQSALTKAASSTAGNLVVQSGTRLESQAFVQHSGTGSITVSQSTLESASRIFVQSGNRNYSITRLTGTEVAQINLSGTGPVTDQITDTQVMARGVLSLAATGAVGNSVNNGCVISGISAQLNIGGTSEGQNVDRLECFNGSFSIVNCTAPMSHIANRVETLGSIGFTGLAVAKPMQACSSTENSSIQVTGGIAGSIIRVRALGVSNIAINGTAGSISTASAEDQSTLTMNGGASQTRISVKMGGTFTTGGIAHNGVAWWTSASLLATVANNNRATYLGLVSTLPVL